MTPDSPPDVEPLLRYFRELDEIKWSPGSPVPEGLQAIRDQFIREWVAWEKARVPKVVPPVPPRQPKFFASTEYWAMMKRSLKNHPSPKIGRPPPKPEVASNEGFERLIDVLAQLPEGERTAIVLKHLAGLSLEQLSKRLGCTPSALAGQLKRGLKKLRDLLRERAE